MNAGCFKCDGTGYCEVELDHGTAEQGPVDQIRAQQNRPAEPEVGFSGDPRGGETYGIREHGRFGSNPLHDDFDS